MNFELLTQKQEVIFLELKKLEKLKTKKIVLSDQIEKVEREITDNENQLKELREKLKKLDHFSFINLYRNWTGKQEELRAEKIDKAATIELRLCEAILIKKDFLKDLEAINNELSQKDEQAMLNHYEEITKKKKMWINNHQPSLAEQLSQLETKENNCKKLEKEIEEAEAAGNNAIKALYTAFESLESASTYSTWDTFLGGGMIATHLKYEKLDESESAIHRVQIELQRFKNELLDIQEMSTRHLDVNTDGFVRFADYFFDDIFSAWSVHSKISSSKEQISRVLGDVRNTMNGLAEKKKIVKQELQTVHQTKKDILALAM
ncbi:hypothetical protein SAMN05880501_10412 [Ureibacillus xyleni]|uniref:Uncharacterized protein n=1 Tax=Ureibacillus xyleni TaxID=614648 RepID=A0A285SGT0_9BACL|nr:hypothetical protein [Ureibacillus xyleni]SOC05141.1 hypothetical protein SAMN05880501_10412 [Ureibacillus xyleni]